MNKLPPNYLRKIIPCFRCKGTPKESCPACKGTGQLVLTRILKKKEKKSPPVPPAFAG